MLKLEDSRMPDWIESEQRERCAQGHTAPALELAERGISMLCGVRPPCVDSGCPCAGQIDDERDGSDRHSNHLQTASDES